MLSHLQINLIFSRLALKFCWSPAQGFSALALWTLEATPLTGAILWNAAVSQHSWLQSHVSAATPSCDIIECLQNLPNVPWNLS